MKTVPLYGKKAVGRVALVDDEDYELVMQYRWRVHEARRPGHNDGPYATADFERQGKPVDIRMHTLITGWPRVDHIDHDGLNNQRYNLRVATNSQNLGNRRPNLGCTSDYKGVSWAKDKKLWVAKIQVAEISRFLGYFAAEEDAALAYDEAARELFGEYAYPNFPDSPAQATKDRWQAERDERRRAAGAASSARLMSRELKTLVCLQCENEFQSRAARQPSYCGQKCRSRAAYLRRLECQR